MVASSESSSHCSSGVVPSRMQVAPEQDFGDRMVAVERGMEREGEELGERGVAGRDARPTPAARPQQSANCRPLPHGQG